MAFMGGSAIKLLAIETTTETCSVALAAKGHWIEDTRFAPRLHNRHVLAMIDGLLGAASIDRRSVELIAFGAGPGSFTGVRIGAAVAQGIALAIGARVIRVPSSAVAAESLRRATTRRGPVTLARTSRPGWWYVARYDLLDDRVQCMAFDHLVAADDIEEEFVDASRCTMNARIVGELALEGAATAGGAAAAVPFYVEGDSPWRAAD
ncbi:MAG: tRNA (adenosine(37)-N6)-threonylcarbamoyltransferase complex dimerization subunit type 1 TsaB [Gammaproteobacteria bacterium]|nr:tRNA (adenosine(37)-N6)-threonylcarbamoyltransferase complex dimerization subunit type 1 TsaB [Gammaproteobacteria bacterium]